MVPVVVLPAWSMTRGVYVEYPSATAITPLRVSEPQVSWRQTSNVAAQ